MGEAQGDKDRQTEDNGLAVTVGKEGQVEAASSQLAVSQLKNMKESGKKEGQGK